MFGYFLTLFKTLCEKPELPTKYYSNFQNITNKTKTYIY